MGSSWPKDQTYISCFGRWILYHWATWGSRYMLQDDFYSENQPLFPLVKWKSLSHVWLFATSWYSPWNSPGQNTGVGSLSFPRGSSQPRDWTQISRIAGRFFTSWAMRETWEYWSSLSLLQQIFLTQESNHSLLHRRQVLYQLNYQGSLAWKILSITSLACEMSTIVWYFKHSSALPFFEIGMKTDFF